ncbi:DUF4362 domain-containing protein [Bacillus sp. MUM 13]|uniref:DUF4362 domain-containing protein n=1 Tax=Bacillus sp. MUM 13 TaxID=1678001 RepID=UPI0008F5935E|nr:DUF4362 domain-containing protein [Bacillus sp. MUM 13]OIK13778.1 hypothetical protein BIV59_04785 [Bacillus sp. MUM 13]
MRKIICLYFIGLMVLSGCTKTEEESSGSGSGYDSKEATKRGDVVFAHSGLKNFSRFEEFLNNMKNHEKDKIRVTGYSHEGDPIFTDLNYDGKAIKYTEDSSNDKHGGDPALVRDNCTKLLVRDKPENKIDVDYYLSDCESGEEPYLFSKDR